MGSLGVCVYVFLCEGLKPKGKFGASFSLPPYIILSAGAKLLGRHDKNPPSAVITENSEINMALLATNPFQLSSTRGTCCMLLCCGSHRRPP